MTSQSLARLADLAEGADTIQPPPHITRPGPVIAPLVSLDGLRDAASVRDRLAAVDWSFTEDATGYLGHDLHPYPAKYIPQIPANLIEALSLRGEMVWDPFGGSGTTALEALLAGRRVVSTDVSPLATEIAGAKCTALGQEQRDELRKCEAHVSALAEARDRVSLLDAAWPRVRARVPEIPKRDDWFTASATRELAYLLDEIARLRDPDAKQFARVVLSSLVVWASNQDSETRYTRRDKSLAPGDVLGRFGSLLADALEAHAGVEPLLGYRRATVATLDARHVDAPGQNVVGPESVDLVVTSPPYANATDYHLYHRFRLFWLGHDPVAMSRAEIGSHLRHQREGSGFDSYAAEMATVLSAIASRLRVGRYAVLVVGDSVFDGKTYSTADAITTASSKAGFEVVGVVSRPIHATQRSFVSAGRRARVEDLVILRRPPAPLRVRCCPPPYRMWPYEDGLRRREIAAVLGVPEPTNGAAPLELDPYRVDRVQRFAFTHAVEAVPPSVARWRTWQAILENGDAEAGRKDPKYITHGLHAYKGKFYPQLAKALLNLAGLGPNARVLDPFCGSGTVLLEGQLNGLIPIGIDLHPLATLIAEAKTAVPVESAVLLDRVMRDLDDQVREDRSRATDANFFRADLLPEIENWFPAPVIRRLGWLLAVIDRLPNTTAKQTARVMVSSIVRDVSQQEPTDLRTRRRKEPLTDAPVIDLFRARIAAFRERLRHFGERASAAPVAFHPATVIHGDASEWSTMQHLAGQIDGVVTSPPYATALPYIDTDRLSLLVIQQCTLAERNDYARRLTGSRDITETERRTFETAIGERALARHLGSETAAKTIRRVLQLNSDADVGFRRRNMAALLLRYFRSMRAVFENLAKVLVPGGSAFFVIGDNKTTAGDELVPIESGRALREIGVSIGWVLEREIPITVTREASLHARHAITENAVLWFKRPVSGSGSNP